MSTHNNTNDIECAINELANAIIQIETHVENGYASNMINVYERLHDLFSICNLPYAAMIADRRKLRYSEKSKRLY